MLAFLRPYRLRMLYGFVLMLAVSGLTLLTPYLTKIAIDDYILVGDVSGLLKIAGLILLVYLVLYAATAAQQFLLSWVGRRVLADIREALFRHLQTLGLGYHDTHIIGITVSQVINDVAVINDLFTQGLIAILGDFLVLIGIIFAMLSMSPRLALQTFTVIPLMALVTWLFSRQARVAFRATRSQIALLVARLAENLDSVQVIQAFVQEEQTEREFEAVNRANREANVVAIRLSFMFLPAIEFLGALAVAIVLWFGGNSIIAGTVTLGVLVAFLAYITRFFQPIQDLSQLFTNLQSAMAGGERVFRLLQTEPEIMDRPDAFPMPPIQGQVNFNQVSFRYRKDTSLVLQDVQFEIKPGQTVALVGPTGAGKSTIARLLLRFYEVEQGNVQIDGIDVRAVTQQSLRSQIGIVTQDPILFSVTIEENIRFGNPGATHDRVVQAAKQASIHDFITELPAGYATRLFEGAVNLSVGQRQLISIARAALVEPRILILDEATANIDTVTEALIQQALNRLMVGRTALVIAHRLST
ncbi:MAG: ABC transporter ATP-binding protein, partial [Anaerolineales bacterium]